MRRSRLAVVPAFPFRARLQTATPRHAPLPGVEDKMVDPFMNTDGRSSTVRRGRP